MSIFETVLILFAVAVALAALARRVGAPYPTFLALGGALLAFFPGSPALAMRVFPDMFSLSMAHKAIADDKLSDERLQARFEKNIEAFLVLVEAAKNYPCIKEAWIEFLGEPPGEAADRVDRTAPVP